MRVQRYCFFLICANFFREKNQQEQGESVVSTLSEWLARLGRHDVEYHVVGFAHGVSTDTGQVVDTPVHAVVHNTLGGADTLAFHRH